MILNENYMLNSGYKIPKIAFGTWQIDNTIVTNAVKNALSLGYRHIDTASAYGNESGIGKAIAESGLSRKEVLLLRRIIWRQ